MAWAEAPSGHQLHNSPAGAALVADPWYPSLGTDSSAPTIVTPPLIPLPPGWSSAPLVHRPPWWHQPVAADRVRGGRARDVLLAVAAAALLMLFGLPPASTGVDIAFAATALALGGAHVLPGGLAAGLHRPSAGVGLDLAVLVLAAGGIARVGGLARPVLGFVVGVAAHVAGQAVIVVLAAQQSGGGFPAAWRAGTDGLLIYRDAAIAAGCGAAVGFLALIGSLKEAVDVDGPYRVTGVHR